MDEMTPRDAAGDRWQDLKDYLETQIRQDYAVAQSFPRGTLTAAAHYSLVSANRSTLGKMREIDAARAPRTGRAAR